MSSVHAVAIGVRLCIRQIGHRQVEHVANSALVVLQLELLHGSHSSMAGAVMRRRRKGADIPITVWRDVDVA